MVTIREKAPEAYTEVLSKESQKLIEHKVTLINFISAVLGRPLSSLEVEDILSGDSSAVTGYRDQILNGEFDTLDPKGL